MLLCILGCTATSVSAATADDSGEHTALEYSYCTNTIQQGVGDVAKELYFKAAIQLPASVAQKYAGCKVTEISVGSPSMIGRHAKVFLTYELGGEPFYTQDITLVKNKWATVKLSTPYTIEGKEFFIGYSADTTGTYKKTYLPIAVDNSATANELGDWVMVKDGVGAAENWEHLGASGFSNVCVKATLEGDNLPKYDVAYTATDVRRYVRPGEEFAFNATVTNLAAKPFRRLTVTYAAGGQESAPTTVEVEADEAVANKGEFSFTVPGLKLEREGAYDLTFTVTAIDGNADENPADNTFKTTVNCTSDLFAKRVLVENFTTQSCGNCPRVHGYLESIMKTDDRIVLVAHHAGFGTDDFTVKASTSYLWFYNSNSTYAPAVMLDRVNYTTHYGVATDYPESPVFCPPSEAYLKSMLQYREDEPGFFGVDIKNEYDPATRQLTVKVTGEKSAVFADAVAPKLSVFLTEDGLTGRQSGSSNKDYVHDHVLRALLTDLKGNALTFDSDNKCEAVFTTVLDEKWNADKMHVVAFIHEFDSNDTGACEVYNVDAAGVTGGESSVVSVNGGNSVGVSAGNGTVSIAGQFDKADVYGLDGRRVLSTSDASFALQPGVYAVKVKSGDSVKTVKVVVK